MSRLDNWVAQTDRFYQWRASPNDGPGAIAALIAERPISIVITRQDPTTHAKTVLAAQAVRIDFDTRLGSVEKTSPVPSSALMVKQRIVLLGFKNNPIIDDTDLAFGDTFLFDGQQMVIKNVEIGYTDRVLAQAEATN